MNTVVLRRALERIRRHHAQVLRSQDGFTMVELMIVVVVIAIIASGIGFTSTNLIGSSIDSNLKGDLKAAHPAAVEHFTSWNRFPGALVAEGAAATAINMPFQGSTGNVLAVASTSTPTMLVLTSTNPKKPGYVCRITIRPSGTAKPTCA